MKTLKISISEEKTTIKISREMNIRKSLLSISEKSEKKYLEKLERIVNEAKKLSKFENAKISFSSIDYYDNYNFEVPVFKFEKGNKKGRVSYCSYEEIPKGWEENISITTGAKTPGMIIKNIAILNGYPPSENIQNKIRKDIKIKNYLEYEI